MKKLKSILLVSYIKNKGIRRICFVIGVFLFLLHFLMFANNIPHNAVDKLYSNLESANADIYFSYKYQNPHWYRIVECMSIYLKKYNLDKNSAYAFTYENAINSIWCDAFTKECGILKSIKDEPIHLHCSGIESYDFSLTYSVLFIVVFLSIAFYLPFILACIIKIIFCVLKWIAQGFKESKKRI